MAINHSNKQMHACEEALLEGRAVEQCCIVAPLVRQSKLARNVAPPQNLDAGKAILSVLV